MIFTATDNSYVKFTLCKFTNMFEIEPMPRSRRRHHSRSRSRSRSHSHERDREPKRRKIDNYESPHHRRTVRHFVKDYKSSSQCSVQEYTQCLTYETQHNLLSDIDEYHQHISKPEAVECESQKLELDDKCIPETPQVNLENKSESPSIKTDTRTQTETETSTITVNVKESDAEDKTHTGNDTNLKNKNPAKTEICTVGLVDVINAENDGLEATKSKDEKPDINKTPSKKVADTNCTIDLVDGDDDEDGLKSADTTVMDAEDDDQIDTKSEDEKLDINKTPSKPKKKMADTNTTIDLVDDDEDVSKSVDTSVMDTDDDDQKGTKSGDEKLETSKTPSKRKGKVAELKVTPKRMSPKQLQKKAESEKKRMERQKEKEEREKKRQEEKEERDRQKEERAKQKQEKEEQRLKEKMEKEEQRQKEKELKEQKRREKEEKEEQKRKEKEQEKLKRQQEIEEKNREKQKQEEKKQKAAAVFVNFFVPKKTETCNDKKPEDNTSSAFMPFEVKSDMKLATITRRRLTDEDKQLLDEHMQKQKFPTLYLDELKRGKVVGKSYRTWQLEDDSDSDDVIIIEESCVGENIEEQKRTLEKMKAKFLKFHENQRPPYFGTWRKRSKSIKPRKPFASDAVFNYEVDSDDEWEEEGEGESLKGSDDEEKENESDNDYEVDNEVFVPHGHLSDDEMDDEENAVFSPETHKAKLKLLKNEFDEEMKSKTHKLKPKVLGCIWYNKDKDNVDEAIQRYLQPLSMICNGPIVIKERATIALASKKSSKQLETEYVPMFLKLIHGSNKKREYLVKQFLEFLSNNGVQVEVSRFGLGKQFKQFAQWMKCPEEGVMHNKMCWYVSEDVRKKYNAELPLPNKWEAFVAKFGST